VERFSDKELEDLVGDEEVKEWLLKLNKLLA
jgi:hypothetical protein